MSPVGAHQVLEEPNQDLDGRSLLARLGGLVPDRVELLAQLLPVIPRTTCQNEDNESVTQVRKYYEGCVVQGSGLHTGLEASSSSDRGNL